MSAFRYGLKNGVDGIELDVKLTKDDMAVIMHDSHIGRVMQDGEGSGYVKDMTYQQLRKMKYKATKEVDEVIPTLEEMLLFCQENDILMMLEMKDSSLKLARIIADLLNKYSMTQKVCIISFLPDALYHVRKIDPQLHTCILYKRGLLRGAIEGGQEQLGFIFRNFYFLIDPLLYFLASYILPDFLGVSMVGPEFVLASHKSNIFYRKRGLYTYTWTINNITDVQSCRKEKFAFATDYPKTFCS